MGTVATEIRKPDMGLDSLNIAPWRSQAVLDLWRSILTERATIALPILADQMEEAGYTNNEVLAFMRAPFSKLYSEKKGMKYGCSNVILNFKQLNKDLGGDPNDLGSIVTSLIFNFKRQEHGIFQITLPPGLDYTEAVLSLTSQLFPSQFDGFLRTSYYLQDSNEDCNKFRQIKLMKCPRIYPIRGSTQNRELKRFERTMGGNYRIRPTTITESALLRILVAIDEDSNSNPKTSWDGVSIVRLFPRDPNATRSLLNNRYKFYEIE